MSTSGWLLNAAILGGLVSLAIALLSALAAKRVAKREREEATRRLQPTPGPFVPSEASRNSALTSKHMGGSSRSSGWFRVLVILGIALVAALLVTDLWSSRRVERPSPQPIPSPVNPDYSQSTKPVPPDSTGPTTSVSSMPSPNARSTDLRPFGIWLFYFAFMLFGMAGQYMWGLKNKSEFNAYEFLKPLWVSLIVFSPFWNSLSVQGINYAAVAAAYQNGFFWKIVLDNQKPKVG